LVLAVGTFASAQDNDLKQSPSFSSAEMTRRSVFVDVIATDTQGHPFNSLTEEDFQVVEKVDWATQIPGKITGFRVADNTTRRRSETPETLGTPPATEKESIGAAEAGAPLTVLLLDDLNTDLFAPSVRQQVAGMADLGCDEHSKDPICVNLPIAVLLLGPKLEMLQDFSMDREALRATLHSLFSQTPVLKDPDSAMQEPGGFADDSAMRSPIRSWDRERRGGTVEDRHTQLTMDAIRAIARHLAGYPGRKKLIWVSSSFPFSIDPDPGTRR
jgi:VWFA-related protein